jgi:hypothetical protein
LAYVLSEHMSILQKALVEITSTRAFFLIE